MREPSISMIFLTAIICHSILTYYTAQAQVPETKKGSLEKAKYLNGFKNVIFKFRSRNNTTTGLLIMCHSIQLGK
jgi:hypothetical protein